MKYTHGAALAPMAGSTDATMRAICARYGAVYTVSEMISAKAIQMGDKKTRRLLRGGGGDAPYGVQLFGHEPEVLAEAIKKIEDETYGFLDLNMGCPAPKIVGHGAGSALLKDPAKAGAFAKAAVDASQKPVTAKIRIGWDDKTLTGVEIARRCEDAGIVLLAVHARTREQMYKPGVNYEAVAAIKQAVSIPVLFNGDIDSVQTAAKAMEITGCDGVMVGRAALGNPFIFREIAAWMQGKPIPAPPTLRELLAVMEEQVSGMCKEKGEDVAMRQARGLAGAYMRGLRGAASLRRRAYALTHYTDLADLINEVYFYNAVTG